MISIPPIPDATGPELDALKVFVQRMNDLKGAFDRASTLLSSTLGELETMTKIAFDLATEIPTLQGVIYANRVRYLETLKMLEDRIPGHKEAFEAAAEMMRTS